MDNQPTSDLVIAQRIRAGILTEDTDPQPLSVAYACSVPDLLSRSMSELRSVLSPSAISAFSAMPFSSPMSPFSPSLPSLPSLPASPRSVAALKVLQMQADNNKAHAKLMTALTESNIGKESTRRAQYVAESEAQCQHNAHSTAANAEKISDLSSAKKRKVNAQRIANDAVVIEMHRQNEQGNAEHDAMMHSLREGHKAQMVQMESDGDRECKEKEQQGRADEVRHEKDIAEMQTAYDADMAAIEEQHQRDLTMARQNRAKTLTTDNHRMAAISFQNLREADELELRQQNEVDALNRYIDAKTAKQGKDMNVNEKLLAEYK